MEPRTKQVEIIVFKIVNKEILFLLLKRTMERGGFWQPITGGVHKDEPLLVAAERELKEETTVSNYIKIYSDVYYFEFQSEGYSILKEYVFGVQIAPETIIQISSEHTDMQWCNFAEALKLLKYKSNKTALEKLYSLIKI